MVTGGYRCYRCYYARLSNGTILEAGNCKDLYYAAMRELKDFYGNSLFYEYGSAGLYYGVSVSDEVKPGCFRGDHIPFKTLGFMRCSSIDRVTSFQFVRE